MTKQATLAVITVALTLAACNSGNNAIPSNGASPNIATPTPPGASPNIATPTPAVTATPIPPMVVVSATPGELPTAVPNTVQATPSNEPSPSATSVQTLDLSALVPVPSSTSNTLTYSYNCTSLGNTYIGTIGVSASGGSLINNQQPYNLDSLLPISATQAFKSRLVIGLDNSSRNLAFGTYDMTRTPAALINFVPTVVFDPAASVGAAFTTRSTTGSTTTTNYLGPVTVTTPLQTYGNAYHYQSLVGTFQQDLYFSAGLGIIEDVVTDGHNATSCLLVQAPTSF